LVGCIFFSVVILFIFGVEFMGFVYLVVYIGAISILFLFIVMLLNINCINALPDSTFITRDFFLYCCLFFKGLHTFFLSNENIFIFYYEGYYSYAFNSDYYLVASII
jgi:NADH:ubiquinone oxidoreductase subunit 6 (subunit J)